MSISKLTHMVDITVDKVKSWFGISEEAIAQKVQEEEAAAKQASLNAIDAAKAEVARLEAEHAAAFPAPVETPAEPQA